MQMFNLCIKQLMCNPFLKNLYFLLNLSHLTVVENFACQEKQNATKCNKDSVSTFY